MEQFDGEVEKALNRAGKASGALTILAVLLLVLSIIGTVTGTESALLGIVGAALVYGVAVIINLIGMQLVVSWGQIRKADAKDAT